MKFFRNSLLALSVLMPLSAYGATVTYSTSGVFTSTGTNTISVGDSTITFDGVFSATVDTPVGNGFGAFVLSADADLEAFTNVDFDLTFTQSVPAPGGQTIAGIVNGSFKFDSGIIRYTPSVQSFNIGGVSYAFDNPSYVLQLPVGSDGGQTTIQGIITSRQDDAVVPEPASMALLGSGLGAFLFVRRRRRA
jgi:hypothetical protein